MFGLALSAWKPPAACQDEPAVRIERSMSASVGPAKFRKMVKNRGSHDAAADHDDPIMRLHARPASFRPSAATVADAPEKSRRTSRVEFASSFLGGVAFVTCRATANMGMDELSLAAEGTSNF